LGVAAFFFAFFTDHRRDKNTPLPRCFLLFEINLEFRARPCYSFVAWENFPRHGLAVERFAVEPSGFKPFDFEPVDSRAARKERQWLTRTI
jgi:hypothetical protein